MTFDLNFDFIELLRIGTILDLDSAVNKDLLHNKPDKAPDTL